MKLYIKQRVFSIGDKYDVYDEYGNVFFDVQGEIFTIGAKFHLCNTRGQELYFIRRRVTFLCARYEIYRGNTLCATIEQEFRFFRPKLNIYSEYGDFEIEGDFWDWDFQITNNGMMIGSVQKKWLTWSDTYELYIPDGADAGFFASLVIAIDNCLHNDNN